MPMYLTNEISLIHVYSLTQTQSELNLLPQAVKILNWKHYL